ncbi:MAG: enoyl-CoA hydratase [Alphaproteobacteria bacterium]|nr:enoyl-CoA hydratase [Alphaproteobacteria bacterium]
MIDTYKTLKLDWPEKHILLVTLNRPEASNALNTQMGKDLCALFGELYRDAENARCVILWGGNAKAFCAGGDLKERKGMTDEAWRYQHAVFEQAFAHLMDCPVPVIAAVNGAAYGGGTEMALTCDFIYAAEGARFALTEVTLGIMPGGGGTQNMPRAVGTRRAKEVIWTGLPFTAQQGYEWGMINAVLPLEELLPKTIATAERIAGNAPLSIRAAKRSIDHGAGCDIRTALGIEIANYNLLVPTEDRCEGVLAFNEKRKAEFRGR